MLINNSLENVSLGYNLCIAKILGYLKLFIAATLVEYARVDNMPSFNDQC